MVDGSKPANRRCLGLSCFTLPSPLTASPFGFASFAGRTSAHVRGEGGGSASSSSRQYDFLSAVEKFVEIDPVKQELSVETRTTITPCTNLQRPLVCNAWWTLVQQ